MTEHTTHGATSSTEVLATSVVVLRSGATRRVEASTESKPNTWPVSLLMRAWSNGDVDLNVAEMPAPVLPGRPNSTSHRNGNHHERDPSFSTMGDYSIVGEAGLQDSKDPLDQLNLPVVEMVCHERVHVLILPQKGSGVCASHRSQMSCQPWDDIDGIEGRTVCRITAEVHRIELDSQR